MLLCSVRVNCLINMMCQSIYTLHFYVSLIMLQVLIVTGKQRIQEAIIDGYLSLDHELLTSKYHITSIVTITGSTCIVILSMYHSSITCLCLQ